MAGWMKVALGILLSVGICGGVAAFVYDLHPMRPYYDTSREPCAEERGPGSGIDCFSDYRRVMDAADSQDRWVALAAGVGAVVLFWVLANLLYFRPRQRRTEQNASL